MDLKKRERKIVHIVILNIFRVSPVNAVVHNDEPTRRRCVLGEGVPGVEQDGDVVVPVKEDQRLLTKYDEDRVTELGEFG